ncbi:calcium release-activated calcium channel protein 1-like [Arctopsyche grandis]|uniref:calcium release-activated calcium channel protein 1-like n=1 Tax=Arctopsyche grandis TaxID=121162 RepID=UPI00406D9988
MCDGEVRLHSVESNGVQVQVQVPSEEGVCAVKRVVSQGTQAGRWSRPPPLRHHASEMLLTTTATTMATARVQRPSPSRLHPQPYPHTQPQPQPQPQPQTQPFYTTRSAYPYDNVYGTYANRVRRRPQPYAFLSDSPNSSLDYLPLKATDWIPDHKKMNGIVGSGASNHSCRCSCHGNGEVDHDKARSPDALSWRRLHMSRAKLKATATTSELLSGFAMIAMVELQINEPTNVPEWLFVIFAVCTTVLVAVHIFALMISTYLLPNIDAASKMSASDVLRESPHERMRGFIELAWAFSTVLGLFLFLVEIAILCWVKFWDYSFAAATAATVIVIPVLIVFVAFAIHFYHSLVVHKYESSNEDIEQLESMKRNLDSATNTANSPV